MEFEQKEENEDQQDSVVGINDMNINARRMVHEKIQDVGASELPPATLTGAEDDEVDVVFAAIIQERVADVFAFQHGDAAAEFGGELDVLHEFALQIRGDIIGAFL